MSKELFSPKFMITQPMLNQLMEILIYTAIFII